MILDIRRTGNGDVWKCMEIYGDEDEEVREVDETRKFHVGCNNNEREGTDVTEIYDGTACVGFLKSRGYWNPLMNAIQFCIHFLVVMMILFGGAVLFVIFEDPDVFYETKVESANNSYPNDTKLNAIDDDVTYNSAQKTYFWSRIQHKYNISITEQERQLIMNEFKNIIAEDEKRQEEISARKNSHHDDKMFVFLKWFYFVTIATSTIGYGDVTPKTDNGKLFYIGFSIVGIILTMTLLRRCGTIISSANRIVYGVINRHIFRNRNIMSEELLSIISILIIFLCYLFAGIWYGKKVSKTIDWSLIDVVYYWIVTFTTVGFGDKTHPLQLEIENVHVYVVYRLFGLAFISAIVDSMQVYAELKEKVLRKKKEQLIKGITSTAGL